MKFNNPYDIVAEILEKWCYEHYFTNLIVRLKLDGEEINVIVTWDIDLTCVFDYDWWEGQKNVEVIGVMTVDDVEIQENVKTVIVWDKEV